MAAKSYCQPGYLIPSIHHIVHYQPHISGADYHPI
jgi:hypothetical protein